MNTDNQEILRRYLDGELSEKEEEQALKRIAEDPALRSMLRFDMNIRKSLASPLSRVPDGFTDRVMLSIHAKATATSSSTSTSTSSTKTASASGVHAGSAAAVPNPAKSVSPGISDAGTSGDASTDTITDAASRENPTTGQSGLIGWLSGLFEPRQVEWRPAWSAGLALGMILLIFTSVYTTGLILQQTGPGAGTDFTGTPITQVVQESADRVMMRFVYVDREAESVSVAGDFSDWEPIALTRVSINGDQAWTGLIPLTRGEHRYMFIKDDEQWVTDPFAKTYRDDGFGNRNAVISL